MPMGRYCPGCRKRAIERAIAYIVEQTDPLHEYMIEGSPVLSADEPGQEILRRTQMGIPMVVGSAMKSSKFLYEEMDKPKKKKRKSTKAGKKRRVAMSKNLKIVNARARKKNGDLKKGWTQKKIMTTAHRMTRKDCK